MTTKEILIKAKALLERAGWTQGCFARDWDGREINPDDSGFAEATCYCSSGALLAAFGSTDLQDIDDPKMEAAHAALWDAIAKPMPDLMEPHERVQLWNDEDERGVDEVIAAFNKAIEAAT